MKNVVFLLFFTILFFPLFAEDQKNIKAEIRQVTVFLNKAQVYSVASVALEAGATELVAAHLPSAIDKQSIQVTGMGDFIIMGVKHQLDYLTPHQLGFDVKGLQDSVEKYQLEVQKIAETNEILAKEEQLILNNQSLKGTEQNLTADEVEDMADFFRERIIEIRTEVLKNKKELKKHQEKYNQYQSQLDQANALQNRESSKIVISVSAKGKTTGVLELQYVVQNAGWNPLYDVRAKDSKGPIQLNYKAQVYQNTGVNWDKVKLKLSTANPVLGGSKPELATWHLDFYEPYRSKPYKPEARYNKEMAAPKAAEDYGAGPEEMEMIKSAPAEKVSDYTTITETTLSAEFDIAIPYSIPSGGAPEVVDIQSYALPATYQHFAIPKLDRDAFLVAQVTGWEDYNLLPGVANIYFEGTYVAESYIDPLATGDTLDFSLGRDKKVVVERKKVKDFSSRNFIGSNKKEDTGFEIALRNTKKDPINMTIEDQIPVSKNSQIEVELLESSGAITDNATGKLVWKQTLLPAESKKLVFRYSVKYPKNKRLSGL